MAESWLKSYLRSWKVLIIDNFFEYHSVISTLWSFVLPSFTNNALYFDTLEKIASVLFLNICDSECEQS